MLGMGTAPFVPFCFRGAFNSFGDANEIFSEHRDFYGFLMDFSWSDLKAKGFLPIVFEIFGSEMPLISFASLSYVLPRREQQQRCNDAPDIPLPV